MATQNKTLAPRAEPARGLISGLVADARDLVSAHADRAKLEIRDELGDLKRTITMTGIAVAAFVVASLLAVDAIALALADLADLPPWVAYAILAVVIGVGGFALYRRRPSGEDIDLIPESALDDAKVDAKIVGDAVTRP